MEKSLAIERPLRGLTINRWDAASGTFMGRTWLPISSFSKARARASGLPWVLAPVASAWNSLVP